MNKYLFDTNIFNDIFDHKINLENLSKNCEICITHLQEDEINKTKNNMRRNNLMDTFKKIEKNNIPTESAVWDVSKWDQCKFSDENGIYEQIKAELNTIKEKDNNVQDALIAETAIKNNITLVTHDQNLGRITTKLGGYVVSLNDFLKLNT